MSDQDEHFRESIYAALVTAKADPVQSVSEAFGEGYDAGFEAGKIACYEETVPWLVETLSKFLKFNSDEFLKKLRELKVIPPEEKKRRGDSDGRHV